MTTAVAGVLLYLALGVAGLLGAGRWTGLLAILGGWTSLLLWAPGFPAGTLGGPPWGVALAGDTLAVGFWALAPLVHAAAWWHERNRSTTFHGLVTLLVGTGLATALSRDLFNLYVLLDLGSLLAVVLVAYEGRTRAAWASLRYLLLSALGMVLSVLGVGLVYGALGTLSLARIAELGPSLAHPPLALGVSLLAMGMAVKAGVILFGLWLPTAHGQAPTGVSVLLSSLAVKSAVIALARLGDAFPVGPLLASLGLFTAVGGLLYALGEPDLKVFLAFSTVSQLGYLLLGIGLGGTGVGVTLFLVGHGLSKALLFLVAGKAVEERGERTFARLAGTLSWGTALGLAVGSWSIVGLPPLGGFVGKGALAAELPLGAGVLLQVLSVGTAAAFTRVVPLLRTRPPRRGADAAAAALLVALGATGLWGIASLHKLRSPAEWAVAGGTALLGYALHRLLRHLPFRLPQPRLETGMAATLLGAAACAVGFLLVG